MEIDIETRTSFVYHSNRLDGITLTEGQTRGLLDGSLVPEEDGMLLVPDGREFEPENATSHWNALYYISKLAGAAAELTEAALNEIHRRMMAGVLISGGEYREVDLKLKGFLIESPAADVPTRMRRFVRLVNIGFDKAKDKAGFAWRVHHEFITIHPYIRANGRMARLLLNLIRFRAGMPIETVRYDDLVTYQRSILQYQKAKLEKAGMPVPPASSQSSARLRAIADSDD